MVHDMIAMAPSLGKIVILDPLILAPWADILIGVDFSVAYGPWVWTYGSYKLTYDVNCASDCYYHSSMRIHNGVNDLFTPISAHCDHLS